MITATESMMRKEDEARNERILHERYKWFVEKWAPEKHQSEFDADLFMLVRAIHSDAAKPYEHAMTKMMESLSIIAFQKEMGK